MGGEAVRSVFELGDPPTDGDFSLADDWGTGSHPWAVVGFAGSSGGAFKLFLGTEDAG